MLAFRLGARVEQHEVSAFWARLERAEQPALDELLERLIADGEAAFGRRSAPPAEFLVYLARRVPEDADVEKHLRSVRAPDMYLAFLCARGLPEAIDRFEHDYRGAVVHVAAKLGLSNADRDELEQRLRSWLFVAPTNGAPGIEGYAGRGSLVGWLRVVAARTAQRMRREVRREVPLEPFATDSLEAHASSPERIIEKRRYQTALVEALRASLDQLTDDERALLRTHYAEGRNATAIGAAEGVHRTTITRRLDDLRHRLLTRARTHLTEAHGIDPKECDAIFAWVETRFDVTLSKIF